MITKLTQFATLLTFGIAASQAFFYLLGLGAVRERLSPGSFLEFHQTLDSVIVPRLTLVYMAALLMAGFSLYLSRQQMNSPLFIGTGLALACLLLDITLAVVGDIPLNKIIRTWSPTHFPTNWTDVRSQWLLYMRWRQVFAISGFFSLVWGTIR